MLMEHSSFKQRTGHAVQRTTSPHRKPYSAGSSAGTVLLDPVVAHGELLRRIRKGQFALGRLRPRSQTFPAIWNALRRIVSMSHTDLLRPPHLFHHNPSASLPLRGRKDADGWTVYRRILFNKSCFASGSFKPSILAMVGAT
jgi:hypothetical protein